MQIFLKGVVHTGYDGSLIYDARIDSSEFDATINTLTSTAVQAAAVITTAFTAVSAAAIKVGSDFEASMSQVAATMGITSSTSEFDLLASAAAEMGEKTKFSASQAAEALNYLALAGYDAEKSVAALPTVLNVAAAGGMELAYASDLITDAMSALGLETAQMATFADQLAVTAQKSNTSVAQLGEAILTVGGTAKTLSGGVVEMNTALGILADNGIKGAEGGTALRNVILSLSAPTDVASDALERLGVSAFDASGTMRPLEDTFADLNTALSMLSEQEKTAALNEIFNKVDLKSVNALLGTSSERFDQLSGYISDCSDAAAEMAKTMDDNLKGDITILGSALEGAGIAAYEKFQIPMRTAVQEVTSVVGKLTESLSEGELSESMDKVAEAFGNIASDALTLLADKALPAVISGFALVVDNAGEIKTVVTAAAVAFGVYEVATAASAAATIINTAATSSMTAALATYSATSLGSTVAVKALTVANTALNASMLANPITAVAVALGVLTAGFAAASDRAEELNQLALQGNKILAEQRNQIQQLSDEYEAVNREAENLVSSREDELDTLSALKNKLAENVDENGNVVGSMELVKSIVEEMNSIYPESIELINGQIIGYNELAASVDNYVESQRKAALIEGKKEVYTTAVVTYDKTSGMKDELLQNALDADIAYKEALHTYEKFHNGVNNYSAATKREADELGMSVKEYVKYQKDYAESVWTTAWQSYNENNLLMEQAQKDMANYEKLISSAGADYELGGVTYSETQKAADQEYADKQKQIAEDLVKARETATEKLQEKWEELEHEYASSTTMTEEELYAKKREIWNKYGDESYKDHWDYYEDLIQHDKDFAAEQARLAEENAAKEKAELEKRYDEQFDIVDDGLNDIISAHKEAYSELERQRENYRNKLMAIGGDLFSVDVSEGENGEKITTYTVNSLDEQLRKMKEYHRQVSSLKQQGASTGLLEELTSLGDEESAQFAKYLSGMSATEFAKINDLYNEKQKLADELAGDLYKSEAQAISDSMTSALSDLATSAYSYGASAAEQFSAGFSAAVNELAMGALYSQIQAQGATRSYENYITNNINGGGEQKLSISVDVSGESEVRLDGQLVGKMVTNYQGQEKHRTGG